MDETIQMVNTRRTQLIQKAHNITLKKFSQGQQLLQYIAHHQQDLQDICNYFP